MDTKSSRCRPLARNARESELLTSISRNIASAARLRRKEFSSSLSVSMRNSAHFTGAVASSRRLSPLLFDAVRTCRFSSFSSSVDLSSAVFFSSTRAAVAPPASAADVEVVCLEMYRLRAFTAWTRRVAASILRPGTGDGSPWSIHSVVDSSILPRPTFSHHSAVSCDVVQSQIFTKRGDLPQQRVVMRYRSRSSPCEPSRTAMSEIGGIMARSWLWGGS
mmetsp:Transcript_37023/g.84580  ORF Transcript_37023/g.84580 Transcript_37023/m.84580 type:complete len:220 (+) Transcript_37023:860-1519(+)